MAKETRMAKCLSTAAAVAIEVLEQKTVELHRLTMQDASVRSPKWAEGALADIVCALDILERSTRLAEELQ